MHYTATKIIEASSDIGEGWRKTQIVLMPEDTAYAPGSTKRVFAGPGSVTYHIHASGWSVVRDDSVTTY